MFQPGCVAILMNVKSSYVPMKGGWTEQDNNWKDPSLSDILKSELAKS